MSTTQSLPGGNDTSARSLTLSEVERAEVACGTTTGYTKHLRRGESACEACRQAKRDYIRAYRAGERKPPRAPAPLDQRLLSRSKRDDSTGCLLWTGTIDRYGYGQLAVAKRTRKAHRIAYEVWVGPIEGGLTVDHMCFVRSCINPEHLRLLTHLENSTLQRGHTDMESCRRGHLYTKENAYFVPRPGTQRLRRRCRACARINSANASARRKAS